MSNRKKLRTAMMPYSARTEVSLSQPLAGESCEFHNGCCDPEDTACAWRLHQRSHPRPHPPPPPTRQTLPVLRRTRPLRRRSLLMMLVQQDATQN